MLNNVTLNNVTLNNVMLSTVTLSTVTLNLIQGLSSNRGLRVKPAMTEGSYNAHQCRVRGQGGNRHPSR